MAVHVIPVPAGMTPEEAWAEIQVMDRLVEPVPEAGLTWAVIEVDDGDD